MYQLPKYRYRVLEGGIKEYIEQEINKLSEYKEVEVIELNIQNDHIHLVVSIPPKLSVSDYMGYHKGKIVIKLFQKNTKLRQKTYWGNHFSARGYFVSTVGINEEIIKKYVKYQEEEEKKLESDRNEFSLF